MRRPLRTALLIAPFFLVGCESDPSNDIVVDDVLTKGLTFPPGTNAILAVKSTVGRSASAGSAKSAATSAQLTRTLVIDSAQVVFAEVKLHSAADGVDDGGEDDDEGTKIELDGPFLVDLVAETVLNLGTSNLDDDADDDGVRDVDDSDDDSDGVPDDVDDDDDGDGIPDVDDQTVGETRVFDALVLPPGTYRRIKFKMDRLDADDAPEPDDPMIGLSVLVAGSIDGVPFEFCTGLKQSFEFRSSAGIVVDDGSLATFLLTIDPLSWFAGINVALGTLSDDGVLRVCGDDNPDLVDAVVRAIKTSARLGRDDDGDGDDDDDSGDDHDSDDEDSRDDDSGDHRSADHRSDDDDADHASDNAGSGDDGSDDHAVSDDGSADNGQDGDGADEDGTADDDGADDDGNGGDGTDEDGAADDDGLADDGTVDDDGSDDDGNGGDGTDEDGTADDDGLADDGTDEDSSTDDGSGT